MPLSPMQQSLLGEMIAGLSTALSLQMELMEYEHDRLGTEYILTVKIAEELVRNRVGCVRFEYPTKKLLNVMVRNKRYGKGPGKQTPPKVRSGRFDTVVFSNTNCLYPISMTEAKIRVQTFRAIEKDVFRFTQVLRILDLKKTPELFGACVFTFSEFGLSDQNMISSLETKIAKFRTKISDYNVKNPTSIAELHIFKENHVSPEVEMAVEHDPKSATLKDGYITQLAALTVIRA